ncbi:hypothetical protein HPP92_000714 [Vanilla planifolia]|uniref:Saposin B-type domain-containing protein n=1 Tax=Vanilla planifolia TaxID=51239 RepID=A0A835SBQ3_VANPL|nr:hypothetical protein HPP92_000714 [Vanilla planifolia]
MITMRIGFWRCFALILFSLVNADARPWSQTTSSNDVSRKPEDQFSNLMLFEETGTISQEACYILPSDLKVKCLEASDDCVRSTALVIKELVDGGKLLSHTGLCIMKPEVKIPMSQNHLENINNLNQERVEEEQGCTACRRSVKDLFYQLNQSKIRVRVMDALLEYCEDTGEREQYCKEVAYKYAPLVLDKLEKLKVYEICRVIGYCDEGVTL